MNAHTRWIKESLARAEEYLIDSVEQKFAAYCKVSCSEIELKSLILAQIER